MNSLVLCIVVYLGFIVAYRTYGKFLGNKLFELSKDVLTPAHELEDDMDYVPARKDILFGHHFTSIAGTGPIVGPAIGVIWGWALKCWLSWRGVRLSSWRSAWARSWP